MLQHRLGIPAAGADGEGEERCRHQKNKERGLKFEEEGLSTQISKERGLSNTEKQRQKGSGLGSC
jgi:hypothetical protein